MLFEPETCLTLVVSQNQQQLEFTAYVVGENRWGLCTTVPQVLHQTYALPVNTPLIVRLLKDKRPIEFESHVLGYQQTVPPTMIIAEPRVVAQRERRRGIRFPIQLPVSYMIDGPNANGEQTKTTDLSIGGLCMGTTELLRVGTLVTLFLRLPDDLLTLGGRVSWSGYRGRERMTGVEFCRLSDQAEQQLARFLFALERSRAYGATPKA